MGLFAEWVMMKAVTVPPEAVAARLTTEGLRVAHEQDGWSLASSRGHEIDALVGRLNTPTVEPVLAGWIHDSDLACLTGVGPGAARFALVIGSPGPDSAEEELVRLAGEGRAQSAEACAAWSQANARSVVAADVLALLEREWTFAEEGVLALIGAMGLPNPLSIFEPKEPSEQSGVVISLSSHMLATLSASRLQRRLDRFSRPQGTSFDGATIELHLAEAADSGPGFDELVAEVQRFVDETGLPRLTIFAAGRAHVVDRQAPLSLEG